MKCLEETTAWLALVASSGLVAGGCQSTALPVEKDGGDGSVVAEDGGDAAPGTDLEGGGAGADATLTDATASDATLSDAELAEGGLADSPSGEDGAITMCSQGSTPCGPACTDLMLDPKNCGACGHDCLGGVCCQGWCQATVVVNTSGTPTSVAADSANVYWAEQNDGPAAIKECGLTTPCVTPTTLVSGASAATTKLVVDASNVYWLGSSLFECAIDGCAGNPTMLTSSTAGGPALAVDATHLYWSDGTSLENIDECGLPGCPETTILSSAGLMLGGIAVNAGDVFWSTNEFVAGCPIGGNCGDNPQGIATFQPGQLEPQPGPLAVDSTSVYWTTGGSLFACPVTGCAGHMTTLAQNVDPFAIAVDGANVYWSDYGSGGSILSCPKTGCSSPNTLASELSGLGTAQGFAMSSTALYYATETPQGGLIARLAKPISGGQAPAPASCRLTVPTFIGFPNCTAGISYQTVTITNDEATSITWSAALVDSESGPSLTQQFSIAPTGSTLAPMESALITITPKTLSVSSPGPPLTSNGADGALVVTAGDGAFPEQVEVDGMVLPNVDFGSVPLHSSISQLIPNFGPSGSGWFFSTSNPAFTLSQPSDGGADWTLTFTPTSTGPQSATLEFGTPATPVCPPNPIVATGSGT